MTHCYLYRYLPLFIALFAAAMTAGCESKPVATELPITSSNTQPEPKLLLVNDSGYITKQQAHPFLVSLGLGSTPGGFWGKELPSEDDTVGKYYKANEPGYYFAVIKGLDKTDSSETVLLAHLKSDGKLVEYKSYGGLDYHCHKNAVTSFCKKGKYFMLWGCGYGSGYGSSWAYVFDSMPKDDLSEIFFDCFSATGSERPDWPEQLKSKMALTDSGILMHYTLNTGRWKGSDIAWKTMQKADVAFVMKDGGWVASDSSILEKVEIY